MVTLCVDEATNVWLARVEISTSCGVVLSETRNLDEDPIREGDTLTVVIVPEVHRGVPGGSLSERLSRGLTPSVSPQETWTHAAGSAARPLHNHPPNGSGGSGTAPDA